MPSHCHQAGAAPGCRLHPCPQNGLLAPGQARGARVVKTGPAELGQPGQPRLSHTSAQGGELEQTPGVGGPWCLVPGNHLRLRPPACPESCASQLMRARAPVDNHWQDGKIEAQCLGTRRALLVSFLVEGAEARFLKPPRKKTEKRGCPDSQLRRTEPPGSPPHLSGPGWRGGSRHRRARRGLGRQPGLPGWKGQGRLACLATHAGSRDYARRLTQAPGPPELNPTAETLRGAGGSRGDPRP